MKFHTFFTLPFTNYLQIISGGLVSFENGFKECIYVQEEGVIGNYLRFANKSRGKIVLFAFCFSRHDRTT